MEIKVFSAVQDFVQRAWRLAVLLISAAQPFLGEFAGLAR
jgi:hypothetical protein